MLLACLCGAASAQTFTQRLQKSVKNQGSVTVTQSAEIDELVNGSWHKANTQRTTAATAAATADSGATHATPRGHAADKPATDATSHGNANADARAEATETAEAPAVDTRKKVMRRAYKVDGYRVQAFAGGNTRRDRQEAERIGNEIKALFPTQPIYVHFYSPRWICRVGNFRTYEEAHQVLTELRKLGYKQALIVKGKITVQY